MSARSIAVPSRATRCPRRCTAPPACPRAAKCRAEIAPRSRRDRAEIAPRSRRDRACMPASSSTADLSTLPPLARRDPSSSSTSIGRTNERTSPSFTCWRRTDAQMARARAGPGGVGPYGAVERHLYPPYVRLVPVARHERGGEQYGAREAAADRSPLAPSELLLEVEVGIERE